MPVNSPQIMTAKLRNLFGVRCYTTAFNTASPKYLQRSVYPLTNKRPAGNAPAGLNEQIVNFNSQISR